MEGCCLGSVEAVRLDTSRGTPNAVHLMWTTLPGRSLAVANIEAIRAAPSRIWLICGTVTARLCMAIAVSSPCGLGVHCHLCFQKCPKAGNGTQHDQ